MIELLAYEQTPQAHNDAVGKQHVLDITNPGAISLTYEVGKGNDVLGRFSPFSQTFRLPFTNTNSAFFGYYYDINIQPLDILYTDAPRFNIHTKCYCEIRVDGVPIIQGSLQLKNVHIKSEEYEVVVFGMEANIFQEIKDKKLINLFINDAGVQNIDYDISLDGQNVIQSWNLANDQSEGNIGAGVVIVPLMDYGHTQPYGFIHYENTPTTISGLGVEGHLMGGMLKPSIQIDHLFREVIKQAGYSLTDTPFLLSDAWTKLYMTLGDELESAAVRGVVAVCVAHTSSEYITTFAGNGGYPSYSYFLNFDDDLGIGPVLPGSSIPLPPLLYDEGDNWNTTSLEFTAPADGYYNGEMAVRFQYNAMVGNSGGSYKMLVAGADYSNPANGSSMNVQSGPHGIPNSDGSASATYIQSPVLLWHCYLEAGQTLRPHISVTIQNAGGSVKLTSRGSWFSVTSSNLTNGIASLPNNMPDISQTDFVRDLTERFNLCIVSDTENPNLLSIQPWQDYIDEGARKDWTDRLDLSQARTIIPIDSIRKKFIEFKDLEDPTKHNHSFQEVNGYPIGKYSQELQSEFVSGKMSNTSIFAPFQVSPVPNVSGWDVDVPGFLIAKQTKGDGTGPIADAKPKLFYHNGVRDIGDTWTSIYIDDANTASYLLCLNYYNDGNPIESDSPQLLWAFDQQASSSNPLIGWTPSSQTYFARYYQQFLLSIYDDDARLSECSMLLSESDIFAFRFNDEIQIENTPYRVLKISNYQPFSDVPCKVQLLKKVKKEPALVLPDPDADCTLNLTGYTQDGNVVFTDPTTGVTSTGTEVCCNENHLYWTGTNCIWNHGTGGGGGGINPGGNPNIQDNSSKSYLAGVGGFNSVKTIQALNLNPVSGEFSTSGMNNSSQADSTNKSFVFYCTTRSSTIGEASENGVDSNSAAFNLLPGMMCRFVIRALSIQSEDRVGSAGSFGSTSFKVWTFMSKNILGTITTTGSEQTDFAQADAGIGTRTITIGSVKGIGGIGTDGTYGVSINCTGPVDTIVSWHLDVSATFIDLSSSLADSNLILLESLGEILTQNSNTLEQE